MDKVYIPRLQPDPAGRPMGPLMRMLDFLRIQYAIEAGFAQYLKSVIVSTSPDPQVDGFEATLTAGLGMSLATGIAVDLDGLLYSSALDPAVVELAAADPAQPRIDVICIVLEKDVPAEIEARDYRELLSYTDRLAGIVPLQQPYNVPTELWNKATIVVRAGVPGAVPAPPALQAGDIPLWQVRVNAGAVALEEDKLTDVRNLISVFAVTPDTGLVKQGRRTIAGVLATPTVQGMLSGPDKTLINTATAAAIANALAKRDPNADINFRDVNTTRDVIATRDVKATRNHVFSDNSIKPSAFRTDDIITLIDEKSASPVVVGTGTPSEVITLYQTDQPWAYEVWLWAQEFVNITLCLETVMRISGGLSSVALDLYNYTDSAVVVTANKSTATENQAIVNRSAVFSLTGTGRKRLMLRYREIGSPPGSGVYLSIWRARIILNPSFTLCGGNNAACPVT